MLKINVLPAEIQLGFEYISVVEGGVGFPLYSSLNTRSATALWECGLLRSESCL